MSKNPEKLLQITKKRKRQDIVKCGKTKKTNSDIDFIVGEHEPTTEKVTRRHKRIIKLKSSNKAKQRRKELRSIKKHWTDKTEEQEGKTYEAGALLCVIVVFFDTKNVILYMVIFFRIY